MELKFNAPNYIMREEEAAICDKDNCSGKDGSITVRTEYPERPVPYFEMNEGFSWKMVEEVMSERYVSMAKSIANDIIIRDPNPKVRDTFFEMHDQLEPILTKDSVPRFLQLFKNCLGKGISYNLTITSQTLTWMVVYNALRCANIVLEGEVPELRGMHANPNCINCYGYFPLHEAAERFSVDMIELFFRHDASANVRTVGNEVIEDLLPLHVAIENTCMHKYLEDNLSPSQNYLDYIYKLIHLICLPEMKIFLDTIRLLAEKTNNLLEELWNYIENGKFIQSAVLLLAAQEQIRGGCSSEINDRNKKDGLDIIYKRILRLSLALRWEKGTNGMAQKLLEERTHIDRAGLLVDVIAFAGEPLSAYIQAHSEVPLMEVLEHVSSILKEYGFCPTEGIMDTINLLPYDCKMSDRKSCSKVVLNATINLAGGGKSASTVLSKKSSTGARQRKVARKEAGGGWDPTYTMRSFFPYWRSVLRARCPARIYPAYARADARSGRHLEQISVSPSTPMINGATPNHKLGLVGRTSTLSSNLHAKRSFSIAAIGAFRLLKLLKYA